MFVKKYHVQGIQYIQPSRVTLPIDYFNRQQKSIRYSMLYLQYFLYCYVQSELCGTVVGKSFIILPPKSAKKNTFI